MAKTSTSGPSYHARKRRQLGNIPPVRSAALRTCRKICDHNLLGFSCGPVQINVVYVLPVSQKDSCVTDIIDGANGRTTIA